MDPRPPAGAPRVPGYTVERPLGAGPYASVWAAVSEHSGGRVALKVLRGAASASAIRREASLLAAVDHPHVMRVVELVETDGVLVLVFPLAEGGSLGDLVRVRGALEPGEVVTACAPIAQALDSVHRRGLVHGDVTPSNILLTAEGLPLLADLGVARLAGPRSAEVGLVHGLTAPEVLGGAEPEPAADVYGLAAVAVLALTGRPPGRPVTLPGIAPATAGAIGRCLDPEPGRRPAASTLASALFAMAEPEAIGLVAAGGTTSAATDASGPAPAPPRRAHAGAHRSRHRAAAGAAAGAVAGAVSGSASERATPPRPGGGGRRRRRSAPVDEGAAAGTAAGGLAADAPQQAQPAADTGRVEVGSADTGSLDTGGLDSGSIDTGSIDTGSIDTAGSADRGGLDTGGLDTGGLDTGGLDTGGLDSGSIDTGSIDTGSIDTADSADTGGLGTGGLDTVGLDTGGLAPERPEQPPRPESPGPPEAATTVRPPTSPPSEAASPAAPPPLPRTASSSAPAPEPSLEDRLRRTASSAPTGRRLHRVDLGWLALVVAVVAVLVAAVLLGVQWANNSEPEEAAPLPPAAPQPTSTVAAEAAAEVCGAPGPAPDAPPPNVEDWTVVLQDLYEQRSVAFETLDPSLLCDVYVPTSSGLATDIELIRDYAENGVRPADIDFTIVSTEIVGQEGARVSLLVTDELPPYDLIDDERNVVGEQQGLPRESWQAEILPSPDGTAWRFG